MLYLSDPSMGPYMQAMLIVGVIVVFLVIACAAYLQGMKNLEEEEDG